MMMMMMMMTMMMRMTRTMTQMSCALDSGTWHMLVDVCGSMRLCPPVFPRTGDENGIDLITEVRSEAISAHSVVIVVALTGSGKMQPRLP